MKRLKKGIVLALLIAMAAVQGCKKDDLKPFNANQQKHIVMDSGGPETPPQLPPPPPPKVPN